MRWAYLALLATAYARHDAELHAIEADYTEQMETREMALAEAIVDREGYDKDMAAWKSSGAREADAPRKFPLPKVAPFKRRPIPPKWSHETDSTRKTRQLIEMTERRILELDRELTDEKAFEEARRRIEAMP